MGTTEAKQVTRRACMKVSHFETPNFETNHSKLHNFEPNPSKLQNCEIFPRITCENVQFQKWSFAWMELVVSRMELDVTCMELVVSKIRILFELTKSFKSEHGRFEI